MVSRRTATAVVTANSRFLKILSLFFVGWGVGRELEGGTRAAMGILPTLMRAAKKKKTRWDTELPVKYKALWPRAWELLVDAECECRIRFSVHGALGSLGSSALC